MSLHQKCPVCGSTCKIDPTGTLFTCDNNYQNQRHGTFELNRDVEYKNIIEFGNFEDLQKYITTSYIQTPRQHHRIIELTQKALALKPEDPGNWLFRTNSLFQISQMHPPRFIPEKDILNSGINSIKFEDEPNKTNISQGIYYVFLTIALEVMSSLDVEMESSISGELMLMGNKNKRAFFKEDESIYEGIHQRLRNALELKLFVPASYIKDNPDILPVYNDFPSLYIAICNSENARYEKFYGTTVPQTKINERKILLQGFMENVTIRPRLPDKKDKHAVNPSAATGGCVLLLIPFIMLLTVIYLGFS